jgi:hypothetical protein
MFGPPALEVGIGVLVEKLCSINYKKLITLNSKK